VTRAVCVADVSCYMPANGETTTIFTNPSIPVDIALGLLKRETAIGDAFATENSTLWALPLCCVGLGTGWSSGDLEWCSL